MKDGASRAIAGASEAGWRPWHSTTALRLLMVLIALLWTQFPLGGGAHAESGHALELCCAWGKSLEDTTLSYSVAGDPASVDVIRSAVREWDDALAAVQFIELSPGARVDVAITFTEAAGRTEGQAVTSFTQRGLIRQVEIGIQGGKAPENTGGLVQIAKHEFGHSLGLGHANFEGNLMSAAVSPQPTPIPACVVQGVLEANRWKLMDPQSKRPQRPQVQSVPC